MTEAEREELRQEFVHHARGSKQLVEGWTKQYWKFLRHAGNNKGPLLYIAKPGRTVIHLKNVQPKDPCWVFIQAADPKHVGNVYEIRLEGDKEQVRSAFYAGFAQLVSAS